MNCKINQLLSNSDFKNVILGVIGSIIASIIYVILIEKIIIYFRRVFNNWQLKRIVGFNISMNNKLQIILPELSLLPNITTNQYPFQNIIGTNVMSQSLTSKNDFLAAKFIQDSISFSIQQGSNIVTDREIHPHTNFSFISIGGTNFYSDYILKLQNYNLYDIYNGSFRNVRTNQIFSLDNIYDYFIICKHIDINTKNSQIIILGLGSTGTTSGGYYFANNWKNLSKRFEDYPFGIIFRVQHGVYETFEEIECMTI